MLLLVVCSVYRCCTLALHHAKVTTSGMFCVQMLYISSTPRQGYYQWYVLCTDVVHQLYTTPRLLLVVCSVYRCCTLALHHAKVTTSGMFCVQMLYISSTPRQGYYQWYVLCTDVVHQLYTTPRLLLVVCSVYRCCTLALHHAKVTTSGMFCVQMLYISSTPRQGYYQWYVLCTDVVHQLYTTLMLLLVVCSVYRCCTLALHHLNVTTSGMFCVQMLYISSTPRQGYYQWYVLYTDVVHQLYTTPRLLLVVCYVYRCCTLALHHLNVTTSGMFCVQVLYISSTPRQGYYQWYVLCTGVVHQLYTTPRLLLVVCYVYRCCTLALHHAKVTTSGMFCVQMLYISSTPRQGYYQWYVLCTDVVHQLYTTLMLLLVVCSVYRCCTLALHHAKVTTSGMFCVQMLYISSTPRQGYYQLLLVVCSVYRCCTLALHHAKVTTSGMFCVQMLYISSTPP